MRPYFQRMIAIEDRECSQCEDQVEAGEIYFKDKRADVFCGACQEYESNKE